MSVDEQISSARETVTAIVETVLSIQRDPPGHPRLIETFETLANLAAAFGERWGDLRIDVSPEALSVHETVVADDPEGAAPLARSLRGSGVRALTLGSGIAREELQSLVDILARAGTGDEDTVSALWRAGCWAITCEAEDDQDEPATQAQVDALLERLASVREQARGES